MKKFSFASKVQIAFYSFFAFVMTLLGVGSIIQCGHFAAWQIGFVALMLLSYALIVLGVQEAKKEAEER